MKPSIPKFLLILSLALLPSLSLHAAVDSLLILSAKGYSQKKLTSTPERLEGKISTSRLDTKQLLQLLAKDAGVRYPNGTRLKVVGGGVFVADSNGKVLGDVSRYFQFVVGSNSGLFEGTRNLVTGEEQTKTYQTMSFTINLPALKGRVSGLLTESVETSAASKLGVQEVRSNGESNVSGKGNINGTPAYFEGTLQLRGLEAILNR